jgi:hypothetical protein
MHSQAHFSESSEYRSSRLNYLAPFQLAGRHLREFMPAKDKLIRYRSHIETHRPRLARVVEAVEELENGEED